MILSFSNSHRYFVYRLAADMRKGFDGLSGLVRSEFSLNPLSGDVFIFFNRPHNRIKILHWQGDGFAIYCKRLEKGTFELPEENTSGTSIEISSEQLHFILHGIVLSSVKKRPRYEHSIVDKKSIESGLSAVC